MLRIVRFAAKRYFSILASSKGPDQPVQCACSQPDLGSCFTVSAFSRITSDAQADLSLRNWHMRTDLLLRDRFIFV